jgi:putative toxin-antitoxin system antitoxin component (TIGR02293 family)
MSKDLKMLRTSRRAMPLGYSLKSRKLRGAQTVHVHCHPVSDFLELLRTFQEVASRPDTDVEGMRVRLMKNVLRNRRMPIQEMISLFAEKEEPAKQTEDPDAFFDQTIKMMDEAFERATPTPPKITPWAEFGVEVSSEEELDKQIAQGLPYQCIERLKTKLKTKSIADLVPLLSMSKSTLTRKKRFKLAQSDRIGRYIRIVKKSFDLFDGDEDAALNWLNTTNPFLETEPISATKTEIGAKKVEELIGRIKTGAFS